MPLAPKNIDWLEQPEDHDYPAAYSYLSLIYPPDMAKSFVAVLKDRDEVEIFKAKDVFRASQLSLLGVSNAHVKKNIKKMKSGISLSPLLLVRDTKNGKVVVADGYHRMCAVYTVDEDAVIPAKII